MGFQQAIKTCFSKYVTFSGRATRPEFWFFVLFILLGNIITGLLDSLIFGTTVVETAVTDTSASANVDNDGPLASLFSLVVFLPSLAAGWRRMHDTGRSGLYILFPAFVMFAISGIVWITIGTVSFTGNLLGLENITAFLSAASLLLLIPIILIAIAAPLLVILWLSRPSEQDTNSYGPNPHEVPS